MLATDPAPVASPSEGHRVAAEKHASGADGAEKIGGSPVGGGRQLEEFLAALSEQQRTGAEQLAEFSRAPAATQTAFWAEVAKRADVFHDFNRRIEEEADEEQLTFAVYWERFVGPLDRRWCMYARRIWDRRWRDRAYRDRAIEQRGRRVDDGGFEAAKQRLLAIPADDYAERLLGPEIHRRGSMIGCPFHDERTPSCSLRDGWFHCHGCGVGGSIYDFAGLLWDLERRGGQFVEIHKRLIEVFP